ncbi:type II toxin-antitoxin system RelE/ParE family toxin [Piscinibacter sp.]|uniref:type II toxin-antitoxin system RelE/ParE family toxin n=1 Tax=Piscinibacter sp. TaxID=1903157 RepID=UPI002BFB7913|nr:type II toxin-antitoxin system RelE/ParE family toxin [Albitalea sp.]HUG23907.1 type II toxin-antitoxin system RelE/ParE family toxin [Albitalea sp.]
MLVEWRLEARLGLLSILQYIAERNLRAAEDLYEAIEGAIEGATQALPLHPYLYRHGRVSGTREMVVHPNYIVVYRVTHVVEILNVLHSRQEYRSIRRAPEPLDTSRHESGVIAAQWIPAFARRSPG